jgi:ubiquinone/menaquinone biosynthesis C-methylase UbiE
LSTERHFDPAHLDALIEPDRAEWTRPLELLEIAGVRRGMTCADVGCGPGFFTLRIAAKVVPGGRVFGVDDSQEMLDKLASLAAENDLGDSVVLVLADAAETGLDEGSIDMVFCSFLYHEVADRRELIREFVRILKPGGAMTMVDWRKGARRPPGPPDDHRLTAEQMIDPMSDNGLTVADDEFSDLFHVIRAVSPG